MTGHGPEAMARTMIAKRLRYAEAAIELQIAHRVRDIRGHAYNRASFLDVRTQMMQEWADYLDELKRGGKTLPLQPQPLPLSGDRTPVTSRSWGQPRGQLLTKITVFTPRYQEVTLSVRVTPPHQLMTPRKSEGVQQRPKPLEN